MKTAMTDNSKSGSNNANPEIQNSDYVTKSSRHGIEICVPCPFEPSD
jgi:hypothetical protein